MAGESICKAFASTSHKKWFQNAYASSQQKKIAPNKGKQTEANSKKAHKPAETMLFFLPFFFASEEEEEEEVGKRL